MRCWPDDTVIDLDPIDPRDVVSTRLDMDIVPADPRLRDTHGLHVVQASSPEEARVIVAARLGLKSLPAGAIVQSRTRNRTGYDTFRFPAPPDPSKLGG